MKGILSPYNEVIIISIITKVHHNFLLPYNLLSILPSLYLRFFNHFKSKFMLSFFLYSTENYSKSSRSDFIA